MRELLVGLPTKPLAIAATAIGLSTVFLPQVTGYGTVLFQLVTLGAHTIVSTLLSFDFAETHRSVVWTMAGLINVILFCVGALAIWMLLPRDQARLYSVLALPAWCLGYLAMLFLLVPGVDGP